MTAIKKKYFVFILAPLFFFSACSSCFEEEPAQVSSGTVLLGQVPKAERPVDSSLPKVKVINIGPSKDSPNQTASASASDIPREVNVDDALTSRLKDKLNEAFRGRGTSPPDIEIYTGSMGLDQFSKYYEDKGLKIQRTSVPASQIIAPLLDEKPELAGKINLADYAGVSINQVIVEGENISAADKYIDPETYEVVYKTFVTVTKMK